MLSRSKRIRRQFTNIGNWRKTMGNRCSRKCRAASKKGRRTAVSAGRPKAGTKAAKKVVSCPKASSDLSSHEVSAHRVETDQEDREEGGDAVLKDNANEKHSEVQREEDESDQEDSEEEDKEGPLMTLYRLSGESIEIPHNEIYWKASTPWSFPDKRDEKGERGALHWTGSKAAKCGLFPISKKASRKKNLTVGDAKKLFCQIGSAFCKGDVPLFPPPPGVEVSELAHHWKGFPTPCVKFVPTTIEPGEEAAEFSDYDLFSKYGYTATVVIVLSPVDAEKMLEDMCEKRRQLDKWRLLERRIPWKACYAWDLKFEGLGEILAAEHEKLTNGVRKSAKDAWKELLYFMKDGLLRPMVHDEFVMRRYYSALKYAISLQRLFNTAAADPWWSLGDALLEYCWSDSRVYEPVLGWGRDDCCDLKKVFHLMWSEPNAPGPVPSVPDCPEEFFTNCRS